MTMRELVRFELSFVVSFDDLDAATISFERVNLYGPLRKHFENYKLAGSYGDAISRLQRDLDNAPPEEKLSLYKIAKELPKVWSDLVRAVYIEEELPETSESSTFR